MSRCEFGLYTITPPQSIIAGKRGPLPAPVAFQPRHFRLTEEGYYPLDVVSNSGGSYTLESFSSPERGVYEAVLREERKPAVALTLVSEDGTIHLRSIVRADWEET